MKNLLMLLPCLTVSALVAADEPPPDWFRENPFPGLGQPREETASAHFVRLAAHPRMHRDMNVDAHRQKKLKEIYQTAIDDEVELFKRLGEVFEQPPPEEAQRQARELKQRTAMVWKAAKLRTEAFLAPKHITRIRHINIQRLRHAVFLQPDYASQLKLNEDQRESLRLRWRQHLDRLKGKEVDGRQSYRRFWDEAYDILTGEQRRAFEELRGPPLKADSDNSPGSSPKTEAGDVIGEVLGKPVMRNELRREFPVRDELARLFLKPVLEKYRSAHRDELELTEEEMARAVRYHEQLAKKKTAEAKPLGRPYVKHLYSRLKLQQHLYRNYGGGRIVWQQAGPEAFDAMHRWLKKRERAGDFHIADDQLRAKFYEYWTNTDMHGAFLSTPKDKQSPVELRFPWNKPTTNASSTSKRREQQPWGQAVAGLQARLRTGITTWRVGESVAFLADVRNVGEIARTVPLTQVRCHLEVDGEVYHWSVNGVTPYLSSMLDPGQTMAGVPVALVPAWKNEKAKPLILTAGKHRVRVVFLAEREQRPGEEAAPIPVPSNAVEIDVTSTRTPTANRDRHIDESWKVRRLLPPQFWMERPTARRSGLPVKIRAETKAVQDDSIALSLTVANDSKSVMETRLPHEWHGGLWPPTDLYASVTPTGSKDRRKFHEAFLLREDPSVTAPTKVQPGESIDLTVRMDWRGTGSVRAQPLMSPELGTEYNVRFLLAFTRDGKVEYVPGPMTRVQVVPAKPKDETGTDGASVHKTSSAPHQPTSERTRGFNPPPPVSSHPVAPSKIWSGGFTENNDPDRWNALPERGYVINSDEWKTLWKAWRPVTGEPPAVDFSKELVFGCAIRGPYGITPEFRLNDEGKLTTRYCIRQNTGRGFHCIMFKIPREGIKKVNFHKLAAAPQTTSQADGQWGSVTGRVAWKGRLKDAEDVEGLTIDPKTRGIRGAFVFVASKPARIHPDYLKKKPAAAQMVYESGRFSPRALILQVGQPVKLSSNDPRTAGNFHARTFKRNAEFNVTAGETPFVWTPKHPEPSPVLLASNADADARAYWLIVENPYAVVTAKDGSFRLEKLPAGQHTLTVWHESAGFVARKLNVAAGAGEVQKLPTVTMTAEHLTKKEQ